MPEKPKGHFKDARVRGVSMPEWAAALKTERPELSARFNISRNEAFKEVEELKLPHYERFSAPLNEFLENPDLFFKKISSPYCYFNLKPLKGGLKAYREPGVTKEEIISFVGEISKKFKPSDYVLTVSEYYKNEYGGNILVNKNGSVVIEFKKGSQGPISHGNVVPQYIVEGDPFTKSLKYSFTDPDLRKAIHKTLSEIPYDDENGYLRGYYEFQLIKKEKNKSMQTVFVDFKTDEAYYSERNQTIL